jgi:hypothetical protein
MTRRLFFGKELGQATLTSEKKKPAWGLFFYRSDARPELPGLQHLASFFFVFFNSFFFKKNYYFLHVFLKITFAFMF